MKSNQRIFLLRHAHSEFQTAFEATGIDPGIVDARLSEQGREQVKSIRRAVSALNVSLIVTSPLTRALETAVGVFDGSPSAPVVVQPLLRELLGDSCDIGRPASALSKEFPSIDFSSLQDPWWHQGPLDNRGVPLEPRELLANRIAEFKDWLASRRESLILVVSHSGFLAALCGIRLPNCELYEWNR